MKTALAIVLGIILMTAAATGGFLAGVAHEKNRPTPLANNTLRWERDPNLGTLYYGWYETDGSAFNYVATASRNHRMGDTKEKQNVPAHKWVQVD